MGSTTFTLFFIGWTLVLLGFFLPYRTFELRTTRNINSYYFNLLLIVAGFAILTFMTYKAYGAMFFDSLGTTFEFTLFDKTTVLYHILFFMAVYVVYRMVGRMVVSNAGYNVNIIDIFLMGFICSTTFILARAVPNYFML